ncbi:MAG: hypothetical protein LBD50_01395 [Rickettsiales bacterium]|jgi:hypothetical protein|nr:hypothetical protein [Rickettsiales bacterium]
MFKNFLALSRAFVFCCAFYIICFACAVAGCRDTEWTHHPSDPGNNHNAWGCDCSENSSGYKIHKKGYGTKNLYDGSKNLCAFPQYSECKDTTGSRDTWITCTGKWLKFFEEDVDTLPKYAVSVPTDNGWEWNCEEGFNKNRTSKKCECPSGQVVFSEAVKKRIIFTEITVIQHTCITEEICKSKQDYWVQKGECVKIKWCREGYNAAVHENYESGDCMDFKCREGLCFESSGSISCTETQFKWGGTYTDSVTGVCIKCPQNQKASETGCVPPTKQMTMSDMKNCYKCDKTDELKNCMQFKGRATENGEMLACARCLNDNDTQCWR